MTLSNNPGNRFFSCFVYPVLSFALPQLYRYSDEAAVNFISDAEISMSEIDTQTTLSKDEVAARARRHSLNTVDVVAGKRSWTRTRNLSEPM